MPHNLFLLFFRSLSKNKVISFINLFGLVLGMLSTILILEYVFFERSYDRYHRNSGNIYRIAYNRYNKDGLMWETANYYNPSGPYLKQTFPEVVNYVTLKRFFDINISYAGKDLEIKSFNEAKTYFATSSIFDVFTIPLVTGNNKCLNDPYTVVLSERAAKKLFGTLDPIGKVITVNYRDNYTVTGIFKNIPSNTHLKADYLFSYQTHLVTQKSSLPNWTNDFFYNYIQLKPGTDYKKFYAAAFPRMLKDNYQQRLTEFGLRDEVFLQPIEDIHLYSNVEYETESPGNGYIINILFWFTLFFLSIVWINYINLVTSQSLDRAKEVGVRKTNGGSKISLMRQFLSETLFFNACAVFITFFLFLLINPFFKTWVGIGEVTSAFYIKLSFIGFFVFILGVVLSGFYPAFVLSSFNATKVLKGQFRNSANGILFRKTLVTIQFMVSLIFLSGTLISVKQVQYLTNKDTGLDYRGKMAIKIPRIKASSEELQDKVSVFSDKLLQIPGVTKYTFTSDIPGQDISVFFSCYRKGFNPDDSKAYFRTDVDSVFEKLYKVKVLAGRFFSGSDREEMNYVLLNQSAAKRLGYNIPGEALNKVVLDKRQNEWTIIGVLNDFNFMSVKVKPVPTFFTLIQKNKRYICLNFAGNTDVSSIVSKIRPIFSTVYPGATFEYYFLDDKVAGALKPDRIFAAEFTLFAILAIVISIIGMLGLIIITVNRSIKEMGVRKILGATQNNLALLLAKNFIWELGIAIVIAVPLSVIGSKKWFLDNYIYSLELNWLYFAIPVFVLVLLLFLVIIYMSRRVWKLNPAEALRYE
jgi:putative ABC transport system permease protein